MRPDWPLYKCNRGKQYVKLEKYDDVKYILISNNETPIFFYIFLFFFSLKMELQKKNRFFLLFFWFSIFKLKKNKKI